MRVQGRSDIAGRDTPGIATPSQRRLVALCRALGFGVIEGLLVRDGESIFEPAPAITQDLKLDAPAPTRRSSDLTEADLRLVAALHEIGTADGVRIEVRHGLPCRLTRPFAVCVEVPR